MPYRWVRTGQSPRRGLRHSQSCYKDGDNMEQLQHVESQFKPLPSLGPFLCPYQRRLFAWFMILLLENCVVPLILYYGLWYGTRTKPWLSLSFPVLFQCFNANEFVSLYTHYLHLGVCTLRRVYHCPMETDLQMVRKSPIYFEPFNLNDPEY